MTIGDVIGGPQRWARLLIAMTIAGTALGISGPFGSYPANLLTRLFYWTSLCWIGAALLWPLTAAGVAAGARRGFPTTFAGGMAVMLGCVPLATIAALSGHVFWPLHASGMRPLEWYCQTLFVALPAVAIAWWLEIGAPRRATADGEAAAAMPAGGPAEPIARHLLDGALCLQMEDHHVRVHGPAGSSLHLAALRDVIARLDEARGLQVHRSWWVARDAVCAIEEDGRAATIRLTNELCVPVARNRIASLRTRGWLPPAAARAIRSPDTAAAPGTGGTR